MDDSNSWEFEYDGLKYHARLYDNGRMIRVTALEGEYAEKSKPGELQGMNPQAVAKMLAGEISRGWHFDAR